MTVYAAPADVCDMCGAPVVEAHTAGNPAAVFDPEPRSGGRFHALPRCTRCGDRGCSHCRGRALNVTYDPTRTARGYAPHICAREAT